MKILKDLSIAISFLTVVPVKIFSETNETIECDVDLARDFSDSMIFFPFVGLLIGACLVLLNHLISYFELSLYLKNAMILLLWVFLTGGLHLDGFADSVDGFSGGSNQKSIIEIMKDGSIGAKGALALFFLLLFKFLLLVEINPIMKNSILLFAPSLSRWNMIVVAFYGKPASTKNSLGEKFMKYLGKKEMILSTIIMVIPGILLFQLQFIALLGLCIIISWFLLIYCRKKIGGITGDILGALNEIIELSCLFLICIY